MFSPIGIYLNTLFGATLSAGTVYPRGRCFASPLGFPGEITGREMKIIDRNSVGLGVSSLMLMENAGRSIADVVEKELGSLEGKQVVVFAGAGGNAGDGFTAARHMASRGALVRVYMLSKPEELRGEETRIEYQALNRMDLSVEITVVRDEAQLPEQVEADVVVDALLGIGARGRVRSLYAKAIETINNSKAKLVVAVDIPSGLDPDTGEPLGPVVRADVTVTFHKPKKGLRRAAGYTGRVVVANIGVPPEAEIYVGPGDLEASIRPRRWDSHKGGNGRVLVVGGSHDYTGAPGLAALAALYAGADLAVVAAPARAANTVASFSPSLIAVPLEGHEYLHPDHLDRVKKLAEKADAVALGMGLGLDPATGEAVRELVEWLKSRGKPVVVDADGLKHLAGYEGLRGPGIAVTPHSGEYRLVFGKNPPGPEKVFARAEMVEEEARRRNGLVIVLKGPVDVVSDGERTRLNKTGAPLMATGGTGDILSGLIASFAAQGIDLFTASCLGVFVNGVAGGLAYLEKRDYATSSEILEKIPLVLGNPMEAYQKALVYQRLPLEKKPYH